MDGYDDELRDTPGGSSEQEDREARLRRRRYTRPPVDIYSTDTEMVVLADMPGVGKEDLQVSLEGDELVIEGAIAGRPEEESALAWGYVRRFKLRTPFDHDQIKAHLENGVLEVTLPKLDTDLAKKIEID